MILVWQHFRGAAFVSPPGSGVFCYCFLVAESRAQAARTLEAQSLLEKARSTRRRPSRATPDSPPAKEALKLARQSNNPSPRAAPSAREQERRLSERETLLNSQLTRIIESGKGFEAAEGGAGPQRHRVGERAAGVDRADPAAARTIAEARRHFGKPRRARNFCKEIEQEAMQRRRQSDAADSR